MSTYRIVTGSGRYVECGRCGGHLFPPTYDATEYACDNGHEVGMGDIAPEWNETADLRDDGTGRAALFLVEFDEYDV